MMKYECVFYLNVILKVLVTSQHFMKIIYAKFEDKYCTVFVIPVVVGLIEVNRKETLSRPFHSTLLSVRPDSHR